MKQTITLAAVAYDPKVVTIWEGMRTFLRDTAGLPLEVVLYLNYGAQVEALLQGRVDIAWNTNLAFLQCQRWSEQRTAPLGMRDTDLGWTTRIIAPKGGAVRSVQDLKGKTLALGSKDSGHAAILPVHYLKATGLVEGRDYEALRFNLDVGKHGDTGTSEGDVLKAVLSGKAHAGAVGSPFWTSVLENKLVPEGALTEVWSSPPYSHCMFTARAGLPLETGQDFFAALSKMEWSNPTHRAILEAEGLKCWVPPTSDGYDALNAAAEEQGFFRRG